MEYYIYGNCTTRDVFSGSVTIILFFFFFFLRFSPKSNILQLLFFFFFLHSPLTDGLGRRLSAPRLYINFFLDTSSFFFSLLFFAPHCDFLVSRYIKLSIFPEDGGRGEGGAGGMGALIKDNAKKCSLRNSEIFENWMALHS